MGCVVGIDLSMRLAGIVAVDSDTGEIILQRVLPTSKDEYDNEYLIRYLQEHVKAFCIEVAENHAIDKFIMEGLSLNSKSGRTDLIAGCWWGVRLAVRCLYPRIQFETIPVQSWRCKTIDLSKDGKKALIDLYGKTTYLKKGVVATVPMPLQNRFTEYLKTVDWPKGFTPAKKREAIYDLCDAYAMVRYYLNFRAGGK